METVILLSTKNVEQLLFGIPENHQHYRLLITTDQNQVLVCSEALVAAITRAYISVKTHPERLAIQMTKKILKRHKDDFASFQLLEADKNDLDIPRELSSWIDRAD